MAITTDLGTTIGQIRLLIGDTVENDGVKPGGGNFSDAELTWFYDNEGSIEGAAGLACETLAWMWHVHPSFEADGLRVEQGKIAQSWWRAGVNFRARRGAKSVSLIRQDAYSDDIPANQASDVVNGEGLDDAA
jgi:hypothetical protein